MTAVPANRIPSHWLSERAPYEGIERAPLAQFILLSILLHALFITLFGAPSGGSREGRAMWGSLNVTLNAFLRDAPAPPAPPLPLKISPVLQPPAARAPAPVLPLRPEMQVPKAAEPEAPAVPPPPLPLKMEVPQFIDRLKAVDTPKLLDPPTIRIPEPTEPPVTIPQLMDRVVPSTRELALPPTITVPAPAPRPAPPPPVPAAPVEIPVVPIPAPIAPVTPTVVPAPVEAPVIPVHVPALASPPVIQAPIETPVVPVPAPIAPITPTVIPAPVETPAIPIPTTATPPVGRSAVEISPVPVPSATSVAPPDTSAPTINTDTRTAPGDFRSAPPPPTITDRAEPAARDIAPRLESPIRSDAGPRVPAPAAPTARTRPDSRDAYDPTLPALDAEALRKRAGQIAREGTGNRAVLPFPMPPQPARKSKEEIAIENARKPDCRTAYQNLGLLAVIPLVANEFGEGSCKW